MSTAGSASAGAAPADRGGPLIFLVAGEPSGDQLGARLMASLKAEAGAPVRFAGIGGPLMAAEGLDSLFPLDELSVMGFVDVLPHIPRLLRRVREVAEAAQAARPAALVTIDSPAFTLRVARRLAKDPRGRGIPLIHYVAPSVWAWKPWRARRVAGYLDHLLALLPFEPAYFEPHGLVVTVVGHPAVEAATIAADGPAFRRRYGIPPDAPLVCVLPGSRRGEIARHEPVYAGALGLLKARFPDLRAVAPTVPTVADLVEAAAARWPVPAVVLRDPAEKYQAFAAADLAIATSGTIAVELAVAGVPALIGYRVGPVTAVIGRALLRIKYASLVNLILDRMVQTELLQEDCTAARFAAEAERLLRDPVVRQAQTDGAREAAKRLGHGGEAPSRKAARAVLKVIADKRTT
jgi:lipid-A-disaccharide synthase